MPVKKSKHVPIWKKLLLIALGVSALGVSTYSSGTLSNFTGEKVVEVVDGDTIIIANRQPIRLYDLNAPEIGDCMGKDAKEAMTSLVLNKKVILREPRSDGRGRVLALVYQNGKLINEIMVKSGLAQARRDGGSETVKMNRANVFARKNKIGIWSPTCYQTEPPDPNCNIKGNVNDQNGSRYFFPTDCRFYNLVIIEKHQGDAWFCSEAEAIKAGFPKSPGC